MCIKTKKSPWGIFDGFFAGDRLKNDEKVEDVSINLVLKVFAIISTQRRDKLIAPKNLLPVIIIQVNICKFMQRVKSLENIITISSLYLRATKAGTMHNKWDVHSVQMVG